MWIFVLFHLGGRSSYMGSAKVFLIHGGSFSFDGAFLNEFFYRLTLAIFCKFPMSTFWYGFNLGQLMKCGDRDIPAGVKYYRIALILPHLIVGFFPLIWGIVINHPTIFIFGFLFTIASVGDLVLLWEMRHLKSGNAVSELPSREGIAVEDDVPMSSKILS